MIRLFCIHLDGPTTQRCNRSPPNVNDVILIFLSINNNSIRYRYTCIGRLVVIDAASFESTMTILLKAFIYLTLQLCASPWLYRVALPRRRQQRQRFRTEPSMNRNGKSIASPALGHYDMTNLLNSDSHRKDSSITRGATPQFWLDLRGTALFPNEAIRFIHDQCSRADDPSSSNQATNMHLVDAVLVSASHFDSILASYNSMDRDQDRCGNYKLYYTTNDTTPEQIVLHEPATQQSIPVGIVMACSEKEKTKLDVVALSEQIIQQQQWVVLQEKATTTIGTTSSSSSSSVSKYVMTQLTEVIQFLSSSSNRLIMNMEETNFHVTASGLFLPPSDENNMSDDTPNAAATSEPNVAPPQEQKVSCDDTNTSHSKQNKNDDINGGIAMVCNDRTSFIMVDALWAEFRQLASIGATTTTVSGITIPSSSSSTNVAIAPTDNIPQRRQREESPFVAAFVLPLDVSIWETVYNNQARYGEDKNHDVDDNE